MALEDTDLFLVNRDDTTYTQQRADIMAQLEDTDYLLVNRDDKTYKITGAEFKGSFAGTVVTSPSISSSSTYAPSTITATAAVVTNATRDDSYDNWYRNGVAIPGTAQTLVYEATESGTYKYEERWIDGGSNELKPSAQVVIEPATIAKPTVIAPADGAGFGGDITFYPETSSITDATAVPVATAGTYQSASPNGSGSYCTYAVEYDGYIYSFGSYIEGNYRPTFLKHNLQTGAVENGISYQYPDGSAMKIRGGCLLNGKFYLNADYKGKGAVLRVSPDFVIEAQVTIDSASQDSVINNLKASPDGSHILFAGYSTYNLQTRYGMVGKLDENLNLVASNLRRKTNSEPIEFNAACEGLDGIIYVVGRCLDNSSGYNRPCILAYENDLTFKGAYFYYYDSNDYGELYNVVCAEKTGTIYASGIARIGQTNDQTFFTTIAQGTALMQNRLWIYDGNDWAYGGIDTDGTDAYVHRVRKGSDNESTLTRLNSDMGGATWNSQYSRKPNSISGQSTEELQDIDNGVYYSGGKIYMCNSINDDSDPRFGYNWYSIPAKDGWNGKGELGFNSTYNSTTPDLREPAFTGQGMTTEDGSSPTTEVLSDTPTATAGNPMVNVQTDYVGATDYSLTFANTNVVDESTGLSVDASFEEAFTEGTLVTGKGGPAQTPTPSFSTYLYNGTKPEFASADPVYNQTLATGVDTTNNALIWQKARTYSGSQSFTWTHYLTDTYEGVNKSWRIDTNGFTYTDAVVKFLDNGVITGPDQIVNNDKSTNVAWTFRCAPGFFNIVKFTGDSQLFRQVPHGLGDNVNLGCVIIWKEGGGVHPLVTHKEHDQGNEPGFSCLSYLNLERDQSPTEYYMAYPLDKNPDSFTLGSDTAYNNENDEYTALCFADNPGAGIKCGRYEGNDSAPRNVDCGFQPAWVMIKNLDASADWVICDDQRPGPLYANKQDFENDSNNGQITFYNNGFTVNNNQNTVNQTNSYIYIAISSTIDNPLEAPSGVLTEDADPSGPSMYLSKIKGTWLDNMSAVGDVELSQAAPNPDSLQLVGSVPAADQGTIQNAEWTNALWTVTNSNTNEEQTATKAISPGVYQTYDVGGDITLSENTSYDVKVSYSASGGIPSAESDENTFKTSEARPSATGDAFAGGFWVGQINDSGTIYDLIIAPKAEGGKEGEGVNLQWRNARLSDQPNAVVANYTYGGFATEQFTGNANYPMFAWFSSASGPNGGPLDLANGGNGSSPGINGYSDWYAPAKNEMEMIYRRLKPTGEANNSSSGSNPDSVPPQNNYSTTNPGQTNAGLFVVGAQEALTATDYQTASQNGGAISIWTQFTSNGNQSDGGDKDAQRYVRAVRRQPAPAEANYFYDTNTDTAVLGQHIRDKHGINPDSDAARRIGFAALTEQPDYVVDGYLEQPDGKYKPIRSYQSEVAALTSQLSAAQATIDSYENP